MYCPKCGNQLPDNAQFCNKCGAKINGVNGNVPQRNGANNPFGSTLPNNNANQQAKSGWKPMYTYICIVAGIAVAAVLVIFLKLNLFKNKKDIDTAATKTEETESNFTDEETSEISDSIDTNNSESVGTDYLSDSTEAEYSAEASTDTSDVESSVSEEGGAGKLPVLSNDHIISATSSSELYENNINYSASNVLDGNPATAWCEGANGYGIGESITLTFDGTYQVSNINILNGYHKSTDLYYKNSRPSEISLEFADGSENIQLTDSDTDDFYFYVFDKTHESDYVKIIIEDVYAGNKYQDTLISEISF